MAWLIVFVVLCIPGIIALTDATGGGFVIVLLLIAAQVEGVNRTKIK